MRKLTAATGIIETIAGQIVTGFAGDGGPAIEARFWDPVPGAVSRAGQLYLADYENSRIRMIDFSTGIVTTVAGSGSCPVSSGPFKSPVCQGGFAGDGGPATHASLNYAAAVALDAHGDLYIADTLNHRIRRVNANTGLIYTIAGTGISGFSGDGGSAISAKISEPAGIAVDASGRVYFTDEGNQRIRVLIPAAPRQEPSRSPFRWAPRR